MTSEGIGFQSRVDEAIAHVDQHLHHLLMETVMKIKHKMSTEKKSDKRKLDANAAVKLAEVSIFQAPWLSSDWGWPLNHGAYL